MIFSDKLDRLVSTIDLLENEDLVRLALAIKSGENKIVFAIGSGGSVGSTLFLKRCRDTAQYEPTIVQTPLEFTLGLENLADAQVWIFSARGKNPDVIASLQTALTRRADEIHIVTSALESPLTSLSSQATNVTIHYLPVFEAKDGFLATHSLMSAVTGILYAFDRLFAPEFEKSGRIEFGNSVKEVLTKRQQLPIIKPAWEIAPESVLVILADPRLLAAATVIETSLWETAICQVQVTDFRNFAHGRHVLLQHRLDNTFILALTGAETDCIWQELRAALPVSVQVVQKSYGACTRFDSATAILDALVVVEQLGFKRGVDPAKPDPGPFAKQIYEGTSLIEVNKLLTEPVRQKYVAIQKANNHITDQPRAIWEDYEEVCNRFSETSFAGIILDYDGTVVTAKGRFQPPKKDVQDVLVYLLKNNVPVAFATGRGGSAGDMLRRIIPPRYHDDVLVGYYNGAFIRSLAVKIDEIPMKEVAAIEEAYLWLSEHSEWAETKPRNSRNLQITIKKCLVSDTARFCKDFKEFNDARCAPLKLVESGHSFDICLVGTCKTAVEKKLAQSSVHLKPNFLCVGDSGSRNGNDYVMLGGRFGVSVCDVCDRRDAGWSFFGVELTGPPALVKILAALQPQEKGLIKLDLKKMLHDK
mgnify:CR=1 FL=1